MQTWQAELDHGEVDSMIALYTLSVALVCSAVDIEYLGMSKCDGPECVYDQAPTLLVRSGEQTVTLQLTNGTADVSETYSYNNKAVVLGQLKYGGTIVSVIDVGSGSVIDDLRGYDLHRSPLGRYIVFNEWFPRMAPADVRRAVVRMYDLALSPEENRHHQSPGVILFPDRAKVSENPSLDGAVQLSGLHATWTDNEETLAFWTYGLDPVDLVSLHILNVKNATGCLVPLFASRESVVVDEGTREVAFVPEHIAVGEDGIFRIEFEAVVPGAFVAVEVKPPC